MTVVMLTFIASEVELTAGIPTSVSIESNVPSTIHYTIDRSTPDFNSPIYVDPIVFPTDINSITLSAFGIDGDGYVSPILTQFFAPNNSQITVSRLVGSEGIVVDRANFGFDISTGWDADGNQTDFFDSDPINYDIQQSDRGFEGMGEGTEHKVNVPNPKDTPSLLDDNFDPFSTPEKGEFFNPTAKVIEIDNRKQNDIQIIPRPYGSMSNIYTEFGGKRLRRTSDDAAYVSGGFVRRFYNATTRTMTGYYFDHNETRYVKNIQELPTNIPSSFGSNFNGPPLIFMWLERGKQSSY